MTACKSDVHSVKKLPNAGRKTFTVSQTEMVETGFLEPGLHLPLVIRPAIENMDLIAWAANNRTFIETQLLKHGAILFRGFNLKDAADLERFIEASSGGLIPYQERSSPRHEVGEKVYTSTDYPPEYSIFPHNEHSYCRSLPLRLHFLCIRSAQQGGETPLADTRRIFQRLDPVVRERFMQKGYMYVRNYGEGLGLSWQTVYQTSDRSLVEQYCRSNDIQWSWKEDGRLRTQQIRPVAAKHPKSDEWVWFNHATFFHVSTLERRVREALLSEFKEEDLPNNTYYGDGSPIEAWVLRELRDAYLNETVSFSWQESDLILLDNMLTSHARSSYIGPRRILFAMSEPYTRLDF